jgi:hypothetical protein
MRILAWLPILALACVTALGCAGADGTDDDEADDADDAAALAESPLTTTRPIFLYYSGFADRADTRRLKVKGGESVIAANRLDVWGPGSSGVVAYRMPRQGTADALETTLGAAGSDDDAVAQTADRIRALLAQGYKYVAVDELNDFLRPHMKDDTPNTAWRNGGLLARRWVKLLAVPDLDRRLILYVNSYNMVGVMARYSDVLRASAAHCRILASEIYVSSSCARAERAGKNAKGQATCVNNATTFDAIAEEMGRAAPNSNYRTITVLGISDAYVEKKADGYCQGESGGALRHQYAKIHAGAHTSLQPGIGGYAPIHATWRTHEEASCLRSLNAFAGWEDAR